MGDTTEVASAAELLSLLEQSHLLEPAELRLARELARETPVCRTFARRLVAKGLLTRWQAGQLLVGWHKLRIGKYRLCGQIGRGDFGRVFLARHPQLQREVAIKTLSRRFTSRGEIVERFLAEARDVAALDHRNILHVFDVDRDGDSYYLVLEYVNGCDLQRLVERHGPLAWHVAADYVCQAASGLAYAHDLGVVHRHLRPANLMVDDKQVIKIIGMGVGGLSDSRRESSAASDAPAAVAVGDYRAPEQMEADGESGPLVDIYALGCIALFLLSGQSPGTTELAWRPDSAADLAGDWAGGAPPEFVAIIDRMRAVRPEDRPASAAEVAHHLQTWLKPASDPSAQPGLAGRAAVVDTFAWTPDDRSVTPPGASPAGSSETSDTSADRAGWSGRHGGLAAWIAAVSGSVLVLTAALAGAYAWLLSRPPVVDSADSTPRVFRREPASGDSAATPPTPWPKIGSGTTESTAEPTPPPAEPAAEPADPPQDTPPPVEASEVPAIAPPPPADKSPEPPVPHNPWRHLPPAVSIPLPESAVDAETAEEVELGTVEVPTDAVTTAVLLGGANPGSKSHRFELTPSETGEPLTWRFTLQGPAASGATDPCVAHMRVRDGRLSFGWDPSAGAVPAAEHLINTAIRLTCDAHSHVLKFRVAAHVEPLTVNLKRPASPPRLRLAVPPDPRHVRLEVAPPTPSPTAWSAVVPNEPIAVNGEPVWIHWGEHPDSAAVSLRIMPELRGPFCQLACRLFFRLQPQTEPTILSPKNLQSVEQWVTRNQVLANQRVGHLRDRLLQLPHHAPTRPAAEQELRAAEADLAQCAAILESMLAVTRLWEALSGDHVVHFRLFHQADDCQVDLLTSRPE